MGFRSDLGRWLSDVFARFAAPLIDDATKPAELPIQKGPAIKYLPLDRDIPWTIEGTRCLTLTVSEIVPELIGTPSSGYLADVHCGQAVADDGREYKIDFNSEMLNGLPHWSDYPLGTVFTAAVTTSGYVVNIITVEESPDTVVKYIPERPVERFGDGTRVLTLTHIIPDKAIGAGGVPVSTFKGWATDREGNTYLLNCHTETAAGQLHWSDCEIGIEFTGEVTKGHYVTNVTAIHDLAPAHPAPNLAAG